MDRIIKPLVGLYRKHRKENADVSEHTKSAQSITKEWQEKVCKKEKIEAEVSICEKSKEKIDVVDFERGIAFELKVSGNNLEHEFYKDIFKVLTFNMNYEAKKLKTFIFASEIAGIKKLEDSSLFKETLKYFQTVTTDNLNIELVGIEY
jgi:hypothetical protein